MVTDAEDEVTPAKLLRPQVKGAVRDGFAERGWTAARGSGTTYRAPEGMVEAPLRLEWFLDVDGRKWGGIRFGGSADLRDERVTEVLLGFPPETMPRGLAETKNELKAWLTVDDVSPGVLAGGERVEHFEGGMWQVQHERVVETCVHELFALIDDRLPAWVAARRTVGALLDRYAAPGARVGGSSFRYRTLATLALLEDRPEVARTVLGGFTGGQEESARMAAFERELAARFPEYGALQRS